MGVSKIWDPTIDPKEWDSDYRDAHKTGLHDLELSQGTGLACRQPERLGLVPFSGTWAGPEGWAEAWGWLVCPKVGVHVHT